MLLAWERSQWEHPILGSAITPERHEGGFMLWWVRVAGSERCSARVQTFPRQLALGDSGNSEEGPEPCPNFP